MKYNFLKASFKNGMVSPRLRGREKEGDLSSSGEKIENFLVDRVGGITKRETLAIPLKQPYKNTGDDFFTYDTTPVSVGTNASYFCVILRGREFIFQFQHAQPFNAIVQTAAPTTVAHYQSKFLTVFSTIDGNKQDCRTYAPYYTGAANLSVNGDLTAFNTSQVGFTTYLKEYLHDTVNANIPTHMTKISDATVVFSCSGGGISFSVSLLNLPITAGVSPTSEVFVVLPYFVNLRTFVSNLGKSTAAADYYCPVLPINFPFNTVNTNQSFSVSAALEAGQAGAVTGDGLLSVAGNALCWVLIVPQDVCVTVGGYNSSSALMGKFIIIPNAANTKDTVFFVTGFIDAPGNTYRFNAIQVVGGTPEANSTKWKLSTFGGETHPKVVSYCFGRLMYGNAGINISRWWASATHPANITDAQEFMQFALTQDASSDVSKMGYYDITLTDVATKYKEYGITDPYRFGFTNTVPNLSPINFIESRTKIHFGTAAGECQIVIGNGDFSKASFEQTKIRTNSASAFPACSGDGKFFYISNSGKDIRFISTEDKYYESQDGLNTAALEGLGLSFNKILWFEKINSLVARTTTNRIFFITIHEDTSIKAITEMVSQYPILDFCIAIDNLYFIISHGGYQHISKYDYGVGLSGELGKVTTGGAVTSLYPFFMNSTINILWDGAEYTMNIPADGIPVVFPFNFALITPAKPAYFYGKRVTSKLRTMPIAEGGGNNSAVGNVTRIDRATVQADSSGPFKYGMEGGTIYEAEGMSLSTNQTKLVNFLFPQSDEIENHLYIESDKPTPLNISGITFRGMSKEGE